LAAEISLRAVLAAVLLAGLGTLVVDKAGAAESLGHRAVRRGRLGVASLTGLASAAPAVIGVAWAGAPAVIGVAWAGAPAVIGGARAAAPAVVASAREPAALA
jgi:hypothetical protein